MPKYCEKCTRTFCLGWDCEHEKRWRKRMLWLDTIIYSTALLIGIIALVIGLMLV